MTVPLAPEVAHFLDCCGVRYPDVDAGEVRMLAVKVRAFATDIQGGPATTVDAGAAETYQHLVATWASASADHMAELERVCALVAKALDAVAYVITVTKTVVLTELAALATTYASIMATPAAAGVGPMVEAAARRLCGQLERALVGYVVTEVIAKSLEPLGRSIDKMLTGVGADAKQRDGHTDELVRKTVTFADSVAETGRGFAGADQPGQSHRQPLAPTRTRGFITPWARAVRASAARAVTLKDLSPKAFHSMGSRATTARKPRETPWSKLARQQEAAARGFGSTVTVPTVRRND
ncbi:hypothetical protein OG563_06125 [Nocardia vinacea]|uniref:PPE family protein n=1 Tax=Nocardia vinacea TaxID=96468 RepID=A0ABZ1YWZ8_9NOCA|nr:hypothetical protein [Nocardia vinacea]